MKILLFSHGSDIDGMGSIIISNVYFDVVDYHYSEIHNLDELIMNEINSGNIYNYDRVFVTDLTPKNETLDIISKDDKLVNIFRVIDHHQTNYNRASNYPFVHINIRDDRGMCCATSLFYDYLVNHNLIEDRDIVKYYSELTRLEDTFEWKNNKNYLAHNLTHLFNSIGRDKYVELMINKLSNNDEFSFSETEELLIDTKLKDIELHINRYVNMMREITINGKKGVLVIIDYQYRNEFPEYLRDNNYDYNFAMMACFDHNSISFRTINDCNVREIAEKFGGGGHDKASACYIDDKLDRIYDILLEE